MLYRVLADVVVMGALKAIPSYCSTVFNNAAALSERPDRIVGQTYCRPNCRQNFLGTGTYQSWVPPNICHLGKIYSKLFCEASIGGWNTDYANFLAGLRSNRLAAKGFALSGVGHGPQNPEWLCQTSGAEMNSGGQLNTPKRADEELEKLPTYITR